ncbi:putative phosphohistidine phosphatase, SixA [gamma proteobacterium HTCC5015]|nr:putative phosphohistidine phosphatase, SixA [gamma proteobacterium HTCC5015]
MKQIYIFRHAQAEAGTSGDDFGRALTPKGLRQAQQQAKALAQHARQHGANHQLIIASQALRTQQTAECFRTALGGQLELHHSLYASSVNRWLLEIAGLGHELSSLVLVGHNPEISALAQHLSGQHLGFSPADGVALFWDTDRWDDVQHARPQQQQRFVCRDSP